MVICTKQNGTPRRTIDLQLSTSMPPGKHHMQSPFHQARPVPQGKKKTVIDAWNGYHSVPLHPDDRHYTTFITTDTAQPLKATSPRMMDTPDGMMKLPRPSPTKPNVWMTPYYGQTQLRKASSKWQTVWTHAVDMGSHSTQKSSVLPKTKMNLQALKSVKTVYVHARSTSGPSPTSLHHAA